MFVGVNTPFMTEHIGFIKNIKYTCTTKHFIHNNILLEIPENIFATWFFSQWFHMNEWFYPNTENYLEYILRQSYGFG